MTDSLLQAIVTGDSGIMLTISAKDLRNVVRGIVREERERYQQALDRYKETPCLTRKQVAEQLGIHPNSVSAIANRGELNPVRIGSKVRYRQSDVDNYLNTRY